MPIAGEKGVPARGVELALREKGGRNGVLSMGAFCVEAGVSPRDGSGYKKRRNGPVSGAFRRSQML